MIQNVGVDTLVCICLALGLNESESRDLLARREWAFSPANPVHHVYVELIQIYAKKNLNYNKDGKRADTLIGYRYVIALPEHALENLSVKIDGKQLLEKPDGFAEVEFTCLEVGAYETKDGVRFTAKATGIALANRKS